MSAYVRKKRRATKKAPLPPKKRKKRVVPLRSKPAKKKKKVLVTRKPAKKKAAKKPVRRSGRTRTPKRSAKPAAKKRAAKRASRLPKRAAGRLSRTVRRVTRKPKKRAAAAKPKKRTAAAKPKKRAAVAKPKKTAAQRQRATRAKVKKLEEQLEVARQKLRRVTLTRKERSKQKAKVEEAKSKVEAIVAPKPVGTLAERRKKLRDNHEHFKKIFTGMLELASKKGKLPRFDHRKRKMRSFRIPAGEQRSVKVNMMLDESTVEEAMYLLENTTDRMSGIYPQWSTSFSFAAMGERIIGSGNRSLDVAHPEATHFQIAYGSSGVFNSRTGMLDGARKLLEEFAEEAYTVIYLLGFTARNYTFGED